MKIGHIAQKFKHSKLLSLTLLGAFTSLGLTMSCTAKPAVVTGAKTITVEHLAQGKTIFENSCAKCHDLPDPNDHSKTDWVGFVNSMAPKAKLTDLQHEMVYDYIVSAKTN